MFLLVRLGPSFCICKIMLFHIIFGYTWVFFLSKKKVDLLFFKDKSRFFDSFGREKYIAELLHKTTHSLNICGHSRGMKTDLITK